MKNDPLGASKPKPEKSAQADLNSSKNQRGKEFETKQEQEARNLLQQAAKSSVVSDSVQQQQQSQSYMTTITQMIDQPRKLLFKNVGPAPPTPPIQGEVQENIFERTSLDARQMGLSNVIAGEQLKAKYAVQLVLSQNQQWEGDLFVTNFKFHFEPHNQQYVLDRKDTFTVPLGFVLKVDRIAENKKPPELTYLEVITRDYRKFKFRFSKEQYEQSTQAWTLLQKQAFPDAKDRIFAFAHHLGSKESEKNIEELYHGWDIYQIDKDFERQGILVASADRSDRKSLFKYVQNTNGVICTSYPEILVVPFKAESECISKSAKFRTKERLPILVYAQNINTKIVSLWRSSQCKTGIQKNRCFEDEEYLKYMAEQSLTSDENNELRIFDCRPYLNAIGQQVAGKGFENEDFYKNTKIEFLDIHNIHKVRDSYKKLLTACLNEANLSMSSLEASSWYDHVISLVVGAAKVANVFLRKRINVLVHCSDGWDRTSQLVSLVQIMIDPHYRSINEGFMTLIQKDWVYAGHQFSTRNGTASKQHSDEQRAPVFIQFLDCVYQLIHYFPLSFEFNGKILTDLAYQYVSVQFGSFLCDSYLEMQKFGVPQSTISVWSKLLEQRQKYINPFFKPTSELGKSYIIPVDFGAMHVKFWKEHFAYFSVGSQDYYQISADPLEFSDENISELFRGLRNNNQVLRQAQQDQEHYINQQRALIDGLKRLIESQPNLADKLEEVEQSLLK